MSSSINSLCSESYSFLGNNLVIVLMIIVLVLICCVYYCYKLVNKVKTEVYDQVHQSLLLQKQEIQDLLRTPLKNENKDEDEEQNEGQEQEQEREQVQEREQELVQEREHPLVREQAQAQAQVRAQKKQKPVKKMCSPFDEGECFGNDDEIIIE